VTREELKAVLKSNGNQLAKKAIDLIKSGGPIEELRKFVEQGCNHVYIERDPAHPRTSYLRHHVLDTCFDNRFGVARKEPLVIDGARVGTTAVIGEVHESEGREGYFKLLLDADFAPGSNGWRGDLFPSILDNCFYHESGTAVGRKENSKVFAKILIASGRFDIQNYACNHYQWIGTPQNLYTILELGADPKGPGMIDNALGYIACAANSGETHQTRADVILRLLELEATPEKSLRKRHDARLQIETYGLLELLAAFGVIELQQPAEYLEYLKRTEQSNPLSRVA
jgi:hypothetical protein